MSAFKAAYDAHRSARYQFPKTGGWKTVHQVARELKIVPHHVPHALRACIIGPNPTIETKPFMVWSDAMNKAVRAQGYRVIRRVTRVGSLRGNRKAAKSL